MRIIKRIPAACLAACISAAAFGATPKEVAESAMEGYHLFMRDSLPDDREKGYALMLDAAWEGDAKAANNIGWLLQHGEYVERDAAAAMRWYARAAEQGLPAAALNWLDMLETEPESLDGHLPDTHALAEAAYLAGSALSMGRGLHYDPRKGEILLLKSALWGNDKAALTVAQQLEMYPDSFSYLPLEEIAGSTNALLPPEKRLEVTPGLADMILSPDFWYARLKAQQEKEPGSIHFQTP